MNDDQRVNLDISQSTGVFSFQLEGYGVFRPGSCSRRTNKPCSGTILKHPTQKLKLVGGVVTKHTHN